MAGVSLRRLIWLSHSLGTMLDAGLPVSRALGVLGSESHRDWTRGALQRVQSRVDGGSTLAEAFEAEKRFPRLFVQLVAVGEESGTLDRTLGELARFYEFQRRLRRNLVAYLALPVLYYVVAVAVISLATHIIISVIEGGPPKLFLYLCVGYGTPVVLIAVYFLLLKPLGGTRFCHEVLLRVPLVGGGVRALALARFSLVMYLMSESAVPVTQALIRSFEATNNSAFAARGDAAAAAIDGGATLTDALADTGLFPRDYMEAIQVAEESGKLSERLDWLASHYADKAEFALRALAAVFAKLVYVIVAAIIVFFIFRFFARYAGVLGGAAG